MIRPGGSADDSQELRERGKYLRNPAFKKDGKHHHASANLTGQANHLGVTIEADIVKQKLPTHNGGYIALDFGKTSKLVYEELVTDNPVMPRVRDAYQP